MERLLCEHSSLFVVREHIGQFSSSVNKALDMPFDLIGYGAVQWKFNAFDNYLACDFSAE